MFCLKVPWVATTTSENGNGTESFVKKTKKIINIKKLLANFTVLCFNQLYKV